MSRQISVELPDDLAERLIDAGDPSAVVIAALRKHFATFGEIGADPARSEATRIYAEIKAHRSKLGR